MPISHYVLIEGQDVSPWVMNVTTEYNIGQNFESTVQQCDITLANPGGKFNETFWTINTQVIVILISEEYKHSTDYKSLHSDMYVALVFTGDLQHARFGATEVKINAASPLGRTGSALYRTIHYHKGTDATPVIVDLAEQFNLNIADYDFDVGNVRPREFVYETNKDGRTVFDEVSYQIGREIYDDESGMTHVKKPKSSGKQMDLIGRVQKPEKAINVVGYHNEVEIRGQGFIQPGQPGDEIPTTEPVGYQTTEKDLKASLGESGDLGRYSTLPFFSGVIGPGLMIAEKLGTIPDRDGKLKAHTDFQPETVTQEQVMYQAINQQDLKARFLDAPEIVVVGRSPPLDFNVTYGYKYYVKGKGWVTEKGEGRVVRRHDSYSSKGWTTTLEIQPKGSGSGGSANVPWNYSETLY